MSNLIISVLAVLKDRWIFFGLVFLTSLVILKYRNFRMKYKKGAKEFVLEFGNTPEDEGGTVKQTKVKK